MHKDLSRLNVEGENGYICSLTRIVSLPQMSTCREDMRGKRYLSGCRSRSQQGKKHRAQALNQKTCLQHRGPCMRMLRTNLSRG